MYVLSKRQLSVRGIQNEVKSLIAYFAVYPLQVLETFGRLLLLLCIGDTANLQCHRRVT